MRWIWDGILMVNQVGTILLLKEIQFDTIVRFFL